MDTSQKCLNFSRDKEHVGTQFLKLGVTTAQLLPLLTSVSFLIKRVFYTSFVMLCTENIGLWDYSGFLLITSHTSLILLQPVNTFKLCMNSSYTLA